MPVDPSTSSLLNFLGVVAFVAIAIPYACVRWGGATRRMTLIGTTAWLALSSAPTLLGMFDVEDPVPSLPIYFIAVLGIAAALGFSKIGSRLAKSTPWVALVAFQGFRLPLEWVLHAWAEQGVVPPQMTWTGPNIDVVSGVLALLAIPIVWRRPKMTWIPSVIGFALLLNVIRIVVQSLPTPLQRFDEPVLLALSFPEVWIASVCVCGALFVHIVTFRALLQREQR